jgi:thiol peroxidase
MTERPGLITIHGNPLTLVGAEIKPGAPAPDVELLDNDLNPVKLSSFRGKVVVLAAVPSLDTPVCDLETRFFNEEAAKIGPQVQILTVSMDLPFAQKRWCGAAGVDKLKTLSDHRTAEFGQAFGLLIKELRLLARAVCIIDAAGTVQYVQLVKEVTNEPKYDEVLQALKTILAQ